ncbi:MAG TPA: bifunctional 5,10-methylene-tetrahydrofolate dehydrogenase/5,10-methylene-tetrahydrofolate cyclohydrolase [Chitinophagaceae bacterium]|nr:bifunctional 5,10-methylene-tetrahydrofolate dehydrogenase/5,10-methylene-tetrahydrofolate cyclohydrolase [Chitinophagaceae bacterium]HCY90323.1 bifunctional 5,10-methylene-tetrahydrofolate dehydrogenase/5,10-methylene-tetrahydrofolate cyclohydrolase [Chitinophagaceae bacterium]HRF25916.1 bifunctional 5,10-methylenetetrahydrofolate dehydrogenase/5,10-methenyltetrahydrofolate cyclohydrolase [Ferruginibacter sp.]
MQLLDGKIAAQSVKDRLTEEVKKLVSRGLRPPHLAAILVGQNGASETYVASKIRNCAETGFRSSLVRMDENVSEEALKAEIARLNQDDSVDGILVQLPLPKQIREDNIIQLIDPDKDVDGFHPMNTGRMVQGLPSYIPATPYGIMMLLEHYKIDTQGKHAVVIGRSNIVGRPISVLLNQDGPRGNCTVTVCHSRTRNLAEICRQADIIVAALGKPRFLKADMVKEGSVVIDVGITRVPDTTKKTGFAIQGDVDFAEVSSKCSYITPVPGGVGLMTIAALLQNTYHAYSRRNNT